MVVDAVEVATVGYVPYDDDGDGGRLRLLESEVANASDYIEHAPPQKHIVHKLLKIVFLEIGIAEHVLDERKSANISD